MRLLVCGGRDFDDWRWVMRSMDDLDSNEGIDLVIHGGARGADTLAGRWADRRRVPCMVFPAAWKGGLGRSAGPIRNGWMIDFGKPDLVLAFPGGRGTANMIKQAKAAGIDVIR